METIDTAFDSFRDAMAEGKALLEAQAEVDLRRYDSAPLGGSKRKQPKEPKSQVYRQHKDGIGYDVYHPTRGWKRVSAGRVAARLKMQAMGIYQ